MIFFFFFRYVQIQHFSFQPFKRQLQLTRYSENQALIKYDQPAFTSRKWTNDLNMDVDEVVWEQIWESANKISVCIGQEKLSLDFFTVYRSLPSSDTNWRTVNLNCTLSIMSRWGVLFIVSALVDILINTGKM